MHSDDGRLLFVGWWNVGLSCLTAPREITYDKELQRLHALPVAELAQLRGESLGEHTRSTSIKPGEAGAGLGIYNSPRRAIVPDIIL